MNTATIARFAATYQADESFTYYVDAANGDDGHAGTKAAPFASLQHALTAAGAGQSIGLKRGTTLRAGSATAVSAARQRIGAYGSGAAPIISGGKLATNWTQITQPPFVQRVSSFFSNGASSFVVPVGSATTIGDTLVVAVKTSGGVAITGATDSAGNTYTVDVVSANVSGARVSLLSSHITTAHTTSDTITITPASSVACALAVYEYFGIISSSFVDQAASASGSGTTAACGPTSSTSQANEISITALASGANATGYTPPSGYTARESGQPTIAVELADKVLAATGTETPSWTIPSGAWAVAVCTYKANAPVITNTYKTSFANLTSFVSSATGGVTTGLTQGSGSASLSTNQWAQESSQLYVNLGGTDPGTVTIEAAVNSILTSVSGNDGLVLRGIEFRHGYDRGIWLKETNHFTVDRCTWRYIGYVSNSGSLSFGWSSNSPAVGGARITRCTIDRVMNDAIWWAGMPGVEIDHCAMTNVGYLAGDIQSDGIQVYLGFGSCAGFRVHHNTSDMTGSSSPKGHFACEGSAGADVGGAVWEYNLCIGGAYGFGGNASNLILRYNTVTNQVGTGGGIQVDATGGNTSNLWIHHNLVNGAAAAGLYVASGGPALTGFILANNTVYNNGGIALNIQPASLDSTSIIANNIVWGSQPTQTVKAWPTSGSLPSGWDVNLYPADYANAYQYKGTNKSTLSAFTTATGADGGSRQGIDPQFTNAGSADFTLKPGSPARGAARAVSQIGVAAAANLGAY